MFGHLEVHFWNWKLGDLVEDGSRFELAEGGVVEGVDFAVAVFDATETHGGVVTQFVLGLLVFFG